MRTAQRSCLCVVAAALLLLSVANARGLDIGDPRNGIDHAPLKVDKIWIDAPRDGRRVLADVNSTAAATKQEAPAAPKQELPTASSSPQSTQAQPAAVATTALSKPAAAAAAAPTAALSKPAAAAAAAPTAASVATAANTATAGATMPAAKATAPGVAAAGSKPTPIPTKPLAKSRKGRAAVAAASIAGAQKGDKVTLPEEKVEQMNWEQLMAEDAPPTACRWEPKVAGIRWNVGCANKPLGSSCNGMVLAEPPFCEGRGGSIATIKCLPDGEWGEIDTLC